MFQKSHRPRLDDIDETPRHGCTSQQIRNIKEHLRREQAGERELDENTNAYFWAVLTSEGFADYYLGRLKFFKSARDDLPEKLVQGHYKCRGNFIVGLRATLQGMIEVEIDLDGEVRDQIAECCDYEFNFRRRTTPEEIVFINETIGKVIENLEQLVREEANKDPQ